MFSKAMLNQIRDTCPLVGLTNLTELWLGNNGISDISPLASLTKLWWVQLDDNQISDIVPLIDNEGFWKGIQSASRIIR